MARLTQEQFKKLLQPPQFVSEKKWASFFDLPGAETAPVLPVVDGRYIKTTPCYLCLKSYPAHDSVTVCATCRERHFQPAREGTE